MRKFDRELRLQSESLGVNFENFSMLRFVVFFLYFLAQTFSHSIPQVARRVLFSSMPQHALQCCRWASRRRQKGRFHHCWPGLTVSNYYYYYYFVEDLAAQLKKVSWAPCAFYLRSSASYVWGHGTCYPSGGLQRGYLRRFDAFDGIPCKYMQGFLLGNKKRRRHC